MRKIKTVIIICLVNITFSFLLSAFLKEEPCVVCLSLMFLFILCLTISVLNIFFYKYQVLFSVSNMIISLLGIYIANKKIFFHDRYGIKDVHSCTSEFETLYNIKNMIIKIYNNNIQECSVKKSFFLGIQIEYYVIFSFFIIFLFSLLEMKKNK